MTEDQEALARAIAGEDEPEPEPDIVDILSPTVMSAEAKEELLAALDEIPDEPVMDAETEEDLQIVEAVSTELALPNGVVIDTLVIADVVSAIKDLDMLKAQVAAARRHLVELVMEERKRTGSAATMHVGRSTVSIAVAKEIVWDLEELAKLRDAGLPEETWNELVITTVSDKVNANVAKRIAGANDDYAKIIAAARTDHEKNPTVTVK